MQPTVDIYEGTYVVPTDVCFALVASRFNPQVVQGLIEGARRALQRHGISGDRLELLEVAGAWELPWACQRAARSGRFAALVALGAVVRGATPHFDYVAANAVQGLAKIMHESGLPIGMGVLTTDTFEQALDRAGGKAGNKGADAALAALELLSLAEKWPAADLPGGTRSEPR